jgi:hypothetical protein
LVAGAEFDFFVGEAFEQGRNGAEAIILTLHEDFVAGGGDRFFEAEEG